MLVLKLVTHELSSSFFHYVYKILLKTHILHSSHLHHSQDGTDAFSSQICRILTLSQILYTKPRSSYSPYVLHILLQLWSYQSCASVHDLQLSHDVEYFDAFVDQYYMHLLFCEKKVNATPIFLSTWKIF